MDNKDKKGNGSGKFNFVSLENSSGVDKEENDNITHTRKYSKLEKNYYNFDSKRHFSFEARVFFMSLTILVLFGITSFFIVETINYKNNDLVYYDEKSNVSYNVCLYQNEFYTEQCLGEEMQYVSDMIEYVSTKFNYKVDFSSSMDYDLSYHVTAVTKIYDKNDISKVLYENEELLLDKTKIDYDDKNINVSNEINVNYSKYNNFVLDYISTYNLDSLASLDVILYLDEPVSSRSIASVSIPLGESTFSISKNVISNINKSVKLTNNNWDAYSSLCAFLASFFMVNALILLYKVTRFVLIITGNKNNYHATIQKILRDYDSLIVIARNGYESNVDRKVIKVGSFDELLSVRETMKKPIIFSKVNDVKCEFIVEDNNTLFKYVLKEVDL